MTSQKSMLPTLLRIGSMPALAESFSSSPLASSTRLTMARNAIAASQATSTRTVPATRCGMYPAICLTRTSNGPDASTRSSELNTPITVMRMTSQKAPAAMIDATSSLCSVVSAICSLSRSAPSSRRTPPRTMTATIQPMMRIATAPRMRGSCVPSAASSELPIAEKSMSPPPTRKCLNGQTAEPSAARRIPTNLPIQARAAMPGNTPAKPDTRAVAAARSDGCACACAPDCPAHACSNTALRWYWQEW